jgi:hypothetical protein
MIVPDIEVHFQTIDIRVMIEVCNFDIIGI